jgi:hypothetical protein
MSSIRVSSVANCPVVGQPGASLVEQDQAEPLRQRLVEAAPTWIAHRKHEVRHVVGHVDEVDVALAQHLIRDGDATAPGIGDI